MAVPHIYNGTNPELTSLGWLPDYYFFEANRLFNAENGRFLCKKKVDSWFWIGYIATKIALSHGVEEEIEKLKLKM